VRELEPIHKTSLKLARHTTYYVAVSACNLFGESALSNEVVVSSQGPVTAVALLGSRSVNPRSVATAALQVSGPSLTALRAGSLGEHEQVRAAPALQLNFL